MISDGRRGDGRIGGGAAGRNAEQGADQEDDEENQKQDGRYGPEDIPEPAAAVHDITTFISDISL